MFDMEENEVLYDERAITDGLDMIENSPLSMQQEQTLLNNIKCGDQSARKQLVEHYLGCVYRIAKKYVGNGLDFSDLVQEGSIGLLKAIDQFDETKGYKFSMYATVFIRQAMIQAMASQSCVVRHSHRIEEIIQKIKRVQKNDSLDEEELAKKIGISVEQLQKIYAISQPSICFHEVIGVEDEYDSEFVSEPDQVADTAIASVLTLEIEELLSSCNLTKVEKEILKLRYGFYNNEIWTLEKISQKFHITKERVRQKENRALKKIRLFQKIIDFAIYMDNPEQVLQNIHHYQEQNKKRPFVHTVYPTIYDFFKNYTKQQVDKAIECLSKEEKARLIYRYGEDYTQFQKNLWKNNEQRNQFFNLISKIKKLISSQNPKEKIYIIQK